MHHKSCTLVLPFIELAFTVSDAIGLPLSFGGGAAAARPILGGAGDASTLDPAVTKSDAIVSSINKYDRFLMISPFKIAECGSQGISLEVATARALVR
jgi:hypothetical protein